MKKIILSESQSKTLARLVSESETQVQQMPVDKKMNKPYCIDPEKVRLVKKYINGQLDPDVYFDYKKHIGIGDDGFPKKEKIVFMNAKNGRPLKLMYASQFVDLLIDKFQDMFSDKIERELFMNQVVKDWLNDKITPYNTLSVNFLNEGSINEITTSDIAEECEDINLDPTEKQKEAGNYKMGHISIKGMAISIENPAGSVRKGTDDNGNEWETEMKNHYGYFRNTSGNGKDGDAVDVFIGPHPESFDRVYVVDQKVGGEFDESKVMLGFQSKKEAEEAYLSNYEKGWNGLWKITGVSTLTFKRWLYRDRKQRKPFFDYVAIKKQKLEEGISDFDPSDVFSNVKNTRAIMAGRKRKSFDGFELVNMGSKMNIKDESTGEMVSEEWFDWVGYMVNGIAIVFKRGVGYNLLGKNGKILLPEWHDDITETREGTAYILIDGNTRRKIKRTEIPMV